MPAGLDQQAASPKMNNHKLAIYAKTDSINSNRLGSFAKQRSKEQELEFSPCGFNYKIGKHTQFTKYLVSSKQ
ncbi:MAG: hypothetical protein KTR25_07800 [Myxococcales bacterium]|nr:hypothetical protein [Myxococcales bacterium]